MVHYLLLVYGIEKEIRDLVSELNTFGQMREIKIFDFTFSEKNEKLFFEKIRKHTPHPSLRRLSKFLKKFLRFVGYKEFSDERKLDLNIGFASPNVEVIGVKEDKRYPDGREML
ncbi:MAG: hypothetical protein ACTSWZ_00730 [Candidatus Heimdallarchaeaceae archaeon]